MFRDPGDKLRVIAKILFVLSIISASVVLLSGLSGGVMGIMALIYAIVIVVSAIINCISLYALADAAEYAKVAAYYGEKIAAYINQQENGKEEKESMQQKKTAPAWNPDGKVPAWYRVEMEKAEAESKKAQTEQE